LVSGIDIGLRRKVGNPHFFAYNIQNGILSVLGRFVPHGLLPVPAYLTERPKALKKQGMKLQVEIEKA
jgi:hypothetical protein